MRSLLKSNPAKFHLDLIWNDVALAFFEEVVPTRSKNNKKNNNVSSESMGSVPDPKMRNLATLTVGYDDDDDDERMYFNVA